MLGTVCLLLLAWGAATESSLAAVTYPHIAVGGGYETVLTITNPTGRAWTGRVSCFQGNYQPFTSLRVNGRTYSLYSTYRVEPLNTISLVLTGDSTARSGFLEIATQMGPSENQLATSAYFRFNDASGKPVDMVSTSPVQPAKRWVFPIERGVEADTGIACLTPGDWSGQPLHELSFTLISGDGVELQRVKKQQSGHAAFMVGDLFDSIPASFVGSAVVDSSVEMYPLVLRLERAGQNIQLTGTSPARLAPEDRVTRLGFRPHDAVYSKALDRIVAVSAKPNRLHLYDPITNNDQVVELDRLPECVAVDQAGERAVVGHNGWLTFVDLRTREVTAVVETQDKPYRLQLSDQHVYLSASSDDIVTIEIASGKRTVTQDAGLRFRLHPDKQRLYTMGGSNASRMQRFQLVEAIPFYFSGVHTYYGYDLWISEDGSWIFTAAGEVYRCSDAPEQDMILSANLQTSVGHFAHARPNGRMAVVRHWGPLYSNPTDVVLLYDFGNKSLLGSCELPSFLPDREVRSSGRFVFFNNQATALSVIVQAHPEGGLLDDFGVLVLKPEDLVAAAGQ